MTVEVGKLDAECALCDETTGEIRQITLPAVVNDFLENHYYGGLVAHWDNDYVLRGKDYGKFYWNGSAFVAKAERPSVFHDYNWDTHAWDWNSNAFWARIRFLRDVKLGESDWTQVPDSPLSDTKKAEWSTYRQALRDVPANNSSVTEEDNITWPTQPS